MAKVVANWEEASTVQLSLKFGFFGQLACKYALPAKQRLGFLLQGGIGRPGSPGGRRQQAVSSPLLPVGTVESHKSLQGTSS